MDTAGIEWEGAREGFVWWAGWRREGFVEEFFEGAGFAVEEGAGLCIACEKLLVDCLGEERKEQRWRCGGWNLGGRRMLNSGVQGRRAVILLLHSYPSSKFLPAPVADQEQGDVKKRRQINEGKLTMQHEDLQLSRCRRRGSCLSIRLRRHDFLRVCSSGSVSSAGELLNES